MKRSDLRGLVSLLALTAAGCGTRDNPPTTPYAVLASEPPDDPSDESFAEPAPRAPAPPDAGAPAGVKRPPFVVTPSATVTLIAPGAEPRRPLRYSYTPGASADAISSTLGHATVSGSRSIAPPMPDVRWLMRTRVEEQPPAGTQAYYVEGLAAEVPTKTGVQAYAREDMERMAAVMRTLRATVVQSDRGLHESVVVDVPPGTHSDDLPIYRDLAEALAPPCSQLPAEPVGQGARWKVVSERSQLRFKVTETVTCTLTSATTNDVTIAYTRSVRAPKSSVLGRGTPAGVRATFEHLEETATGTRVFELSTPEGLSREDSTLTLRGFLEYEDTESDIDIVIRSHAETRPKVKRAAP